MNPSTASLLAFACLSACNAPVPTVSLESFPYPVSLEAVARAKSLRDTVEAVVNGGGNPGRRAAALLRIQELGLAEEAHTEWIDWFSFQKNVLIEIPGQEDEIVYVVAHLDKTDGNPLKLASVLVNGILDEAIAWSYFSSGAIDNATGVAVAIELGAAIRKAKLRRTYRILLAGSEESGLRGSRAHAARLTDEEWKRIRLVINLDCVGLSFSPNAVLSDVSDQELAGRALKTAERLKLPLNEGKMPSGAGSDYWSFAGTGFFRDFLFGLSANLVGGLLPQRSWFAGRHSAKVLAFSVDPLEGDDFVSILLSIPQLFFIPTDQLHGPRDRTSLVDPIRLYEQYLIVIELLKDLEQDRVEGKSEP